MLYTRTRFETEAKGNSEIAYCRAFCKKLCQLLQFDVRLGLGTTPFWLKSNSKFPLPQKIEGFNLVKHKKRKNQKSKMGLLY